jgi:hypothetical protein
MTTPGVGPVVALIYRATVDVPARFRKSKAVGAVFGLTCSKYQSVSEPRPSVGCFPWVRPFPPRPPFVRPFPRYCSLIRLLIHVHARRAACGLPEPARHSVRAWTRPPRFRAKNVSTCTRSPTARGSTHASHLP